MNTIRIFLWGLVAAMTIHGFLHADDYGTAATVLGGVSLTMSIWKESISEATRSLFWSQPRYVGIPRALVVAALKETTMHPGIHTIPQLQTALTGHHQSWERFRTHEVQWMLRHSELIGGLLSDPDGRDVWSFWETRMQSAHDELTAATQKARDCLVPAEFVKRIGLCKTDDARIQKYTARLARATAAMSVWRKILYFQEHVEAPIWWDSTNTIPHENMSDAFVEYRHQLRQLHNVTDPADKRVTHLTAAAREMARYVNTLSVWESQLMESLLLGDLWTACLEHIRLREGRVRELMMAAGIQDMLNAHERIFNASLRVTKETKTVQEWFGEMASYAWWLGDDIPNIVRRCISQETGDCKRIGPTEIATLSAQMLEQRRIINDWTRRVFIGMWNGMPVVFLLFLLEIVVLCIPQRRLITFSTDSAMQEAPPLLREAPTNRALIGN